MGPVSDEENAALMPFNIDRTHKNNLPVYTEFRMGGQQKRTVIRKLTGDVNAF